MNGWRTNSLQANTHLPIVRNKEDQFNLFPIGLIIITKDKLNEYSISYANHFAWKLLNIPQNLDIKVFRQNCYSYKKWEMNKLEDITLSEIWFGREDKQESSGTFISSNSMVYVKTRPQKSQIFISVDDYNEERKRLQGDLVKSLKYQYLLTWYHEIHNPINGLINISTSNTEGNTVNNIDNEQIVWLITWIKFFLNSFIWYFKIIFELNSANSLINEQQPTVQLDTTINLEYMFTKITNKFYIPYTYKCIKFNNNFSFLSDRYIKSNEKYFKNFLKTIYLYLYHTIVKDEGCKVKYTVWENNAIKISFNRVNSFGNKYKPKKLNNSRKNDIFDLKFTQNYDVANTVQTLEITKDLIIKYGTILNVRVKIFTEDEVFLFLIIPTLSEPGDDDFNINEDENEFTQSQKNFALQAWNRKLAVKQASKQPQQKKVNVNIMSSTKPSSELLNREESDWNLDKLKEITKRQIDLHWKNTAFGATLKNKKKTDLKKLEDEPFIKMSEKQNPFSLQQYHTHNFEEDDWVQLNKLKKNFLQNPPHKHNAKLKYTTSFPDHFKKQLSSSSGWEYSVHEVPEEYTDDNRSFSANTMDKKKKSNTLQKDGRKNVDNLAMNEVKRKKKISDTTFHDRELLNQSHCQTQKTFNQTPLNKLKNCKCTDILICDDEDFNIKAISNWLLKKHNWIADNCNNGQECINKLIEKKENDCVCGLREYRLLFLDIVMPVMDGVIASKQIQGMIDNHVISDRLNIIIVSAHIDEVWKKCLSEITCIKFFASKPVKTEKLSNIISMYYFKD